MSIYFGTVGQINHHERVKTVQEKSNIDVERDNLAYFTVELDNTHPVPESWGSQDASTGYARILIDLGTREIHRMEMVLDGMYAFGDPDTQNILQQNFSTTQPFHFHNLPQGGPNFFVQQLFDFDAGSNEISTASLENTETGFRFSIEETYALRPPVNNPDLEDVVVEEILAGNGYLGLHTEALFIPATAIAGEINVFGNGVMDGDIIWEGDERDVVTGSRQNDLLSLGGGDDFANGLTGDDVLDGGAGNDHLLGQRGDDTVWGGDGDDLIIGGKGDDQLYGNRGHDDLRGGHGDDVLDGGHGEDVLNGGRGNDVLTGGNDADVFVFHLLSGMDTITDFQVEEDTLEFSGAQRVLDAELLDLDGGGVANDTQLTLIGGQVSVLNADLSDGFWI